MTEEEKKARRQVSRKLLANVEKAIDDLHNDMRGGPFQYKGVNYDFKKVGKLLLIVEIESE